MLYLFKACGKCGGDLLQDSDEWHCFQCGHVYYPQHSRMELPVEAPNVEEQDFAFEPVDSQARRKIRRSARHLNPSLESTRSHEKKWLKKNRQVIYHLDQGKKVREIAEIVGKGPRQIRVVRERLRDLRSAEPELVGAK